MLSVHVHLCIPYIQSLGISQKGQFTVVVNHVVITCLSCDTIYYSQGDDSLRLDRLECILFLIIILKVSAHWKNLDQCTKSKHLLSKLIWFHLQCQLPPVITLATIYVGKCSLANLGQRSHHSVGDDKDKRDKRWNRVYKYLSNLQFYSGSVLTFL